MVSSSNNNNGAGIMGKRISINNGSTYHGAGDFTDDFLVGPLWDAIAHMMDDDTRERVHGEIAPCGNRAFLARYLELAPCDLVVG